MIRARGVRATPSSSFSDRVNTEPKDRNNYHKIRKNNSSIRIGHMMILTLIILCVMIGYSLCVRTVLANHQRERLSGTVDSDISVESFRLAKEKVKEEFVRRYGGEEIAKDLLSRGLFTLDKKENELYPIGVRNTAKLILTRMATSSPFKISFGGYSVTVGRGNYFTQSYPFVLRDILSPLFSILGVELQVKNAAIGGIPSFPYGWCMENFLGEDVDIISWDYGMNEMKSVEGLEAYLRHGIMSRKDEPPVMVIIDKGTRPRKELLKRYIDTDNNDETITKLSHAIFLNSEDYVPKQYFELDNVPPGLQKWDEWGGPKGAPGQSNWHPKYKRHELMGWVLSMHILEALDMVQDILTTNPNWKSEYQQKHPSTSPRLLSTPLSTHEKSNVDSLFYGVEHSGTDHYRMNKIVCKTSFQPTVSGHLEDIIVGGIAPAPKNILEDRNEELYNQGWVVDIGKTERDTKKKVEISGGMGYIDMKEAYYGIPGSGALQLFLPLDEHHRVNPTNLNASLLFHTIVICEVNEKRGDKECQMETDLTITVGGALVDSMSKISKGAVYLNKEICLVVDVPSEAIITKRSKGPKKDQLGLEVGIAVTGKSVNRKNGACSISHVIWEYHERD